MYTARQVENKETKYFKTFENSQVYDQLNGPAEAFHFVPTKMIWD